MSGKNAILLGKQVNYPQQYCKEILAAIPRSENRKLYGIEEKSQVFYGCDCWHAYEVGFLLKTGVPVAGVLKIVYSSDSQFIVESKSLKLYLGSFNMEAIGSTREEGISIFTDRIKNDLSELLSTNVQVHFHRNFSTNTPFDFEPYIILEEDKSCEPIQISKYNETPALLEECINKQAGELKIGSHLLRSNCKITNQPDWGSIYIHLKAQQCPSPASILKYIVSMRNENHFHEEICEMTYKRLYDIFNPEILTVTCLYTRRGGIDICPVRSNQKEYLPSNLIREDILTPRTLRQ